VAQLRVDIDSAEEEPVVETKLKGESDNQDTKHRLGKSRGKWRSKVDFNTGRVYYYNKTTQETSWERPPGFEEGDRSSLRSSYDPSRRLSAAEADEDYSRTSDRSYEPGPRSIRSLHTMDTDFKRRQSCPSPATAGRSMYTNKSASMATMEELKDGFRKAEFSDSDDDGTAFGRIMISNMNRRKSLVNMTTKADDPGDDLKHGVSFYLAMKERKPKSLASMLELRYELVKHEEGKERPDSDDELPPEGYRLTKHRKGFWNRLLRIGNAHDNDKLLSFKKSLIRKALLKTNRTHDEQAIQTFKNIMSFMGDRPSSKSPARHARKIIRNALRSPIGLRDEVYLQICKQTNCHPNQRHALEGWNLMLICLHSFPPSRNIKVADYIRKALELSQSREIKARAQIALLLLDIIEHLGERRLPPPEIEVSAISRLELIELSVRLPDSKTNTNNACLNIAVDPFTTVAQAEQMLCDRIGLQFSPAFGLYEASDGTHELLDGSRRVMDVVSSWTLTKTEEDILSEKLRSKKRETSRKKPPTGKRAHKRKKMQYKYLLFQAKLALNTGGKDPYKELVSDPKAVNLLYNQAKRDVMMGILEPETRDVPKLAALKLQVDEGDHVKEFHHKGSLINKMKEYIPISLMPKNPKSKIGSVILRSFEQKILHKHSKLQGFTAHSAKRNFLDYVEKWPTYGANLFSIQQKRQFKSYPEFLNLGIGPSGVFLQHPEGGEVLDTFTYKDVVTWGYSERRFILVVGDVVQQKKLVFQTSKGAVMRQLIHAYIYYKVKSKVKSQPADPAAASLRSGVASATADIQNPTYDGTRLSYAMTR